MQNTEAEAKAIFEELSKQAKALGDLSQRALAAIGWYKQQAEGSYQRAEHFRLMLSQAEHKIAQAEHRAGVAERANSELQERLEALQQELARREQPSEEEVERQRVAMELSMATRPKF